jgi:hypothetical protein
MFPFNLFLIVDRFMNYACELVEIINHYLLVFIPLYISYIAWFNDLKYPS